jgi:hypothetical protein
MICRGYPSQRHVRQPMLLYSLLRKEIQMAPDSGLSIWDYIPGRWLFPGRRPGLPDRPNLGFGFRRLAARRFSGSGARLCLPYPPRPPHRGPRQGGRATATFAQACGAAGHSYRSPGSEPEESCPALTPAPAPSALSSRRDLRRRQRGLPWPLMKRALPQRQQAVG